MNPKDTLMARTIQLPLDIADAEVLSIDAKSSMHHMLFLLAHLTI
jgi:hypothetical protein